MTVMLAAVTMALSLAHLLELPGKMRLPKEQYLAVQAIYYPGFTILGASEPLGILVTALLAFLTPSGGARDLLAGACIALALMHLIYWVWVHPVNNFWVRDISLRGAGRAFFRFGLQALPSPGLAEWTSLRDRWEYSHAARAVVALLAF